MTQFSKIILACTSALAGCGGSNTPPRGAVTSAALPQATVTPGMSCAQEGVLACPDGHIDACLGDPDRGNFHKCIPGPPDPTIPEADPAIAEARLIPEAGPEALASVQKLTEEVEAISTTGQQDHQRIAVALRSLAEAIQVVGTRDSDALARMRDSIEQLEMLPDSSVLHADHARSAFDEAVTAIASGSPQMRSDLAKYAHELSEFSTAVHQLDPRQPLLDQQLLVIRALERVVRLLHVAVGETPPAAPPPDADNT